MPIELTCPNGHRLVAKDSNAGRKGKCPVCKASVSIPMITEAAITESAIISILGDPGLKKTERVGKTLTPPKNPVSKSPIPKNQVTAASSTFREETSGSSVSMPHIKLCPSCEREIDLGYHICPHCHTYITGLDDF